MRQKGVTHDKLEMVFAEEPFSAIRATVATERVETGGILLGSRDDYVVKKFIFDPYGSRFSAGYDPDVNFLNKVIKEEWANNQLALLGFVHSHPRGIRRLSGDWGNGYGDVGYLRKIFAAIPVLEKFLVPIVYSTADGGPFEIFPYIAFRDSAEDYKEADLIVNKTEVELPRSSSRIVDLAPPDTTSSDETRQSRSQAELGAEVETYRTRDGKAHFAFRFVKAGDHYEADIVDMPEYGNSDTSLQLTHRMRSPRGGYQADLGLLDHQKDLGSMRRLASWWSEMTWNYIKENERS
jgi:hypothetical protein